MAGVLRHGPIPIRKLSITGIVLLDINTLLIVALVLKLINFAVRRASTTLMAKFNYGLAALQALSCASQSDTLNPAPAFAASAHVLFSLELYMKGSTCVECHRRGHRRLTY